ncbi:MAG: hypothetical protein ACRESZ_19900 [Methylococcales bacterium]
MWHSLVIFVRLPFLLVGLMALTTIRIPLTVAPNVVTFVLVPIFAPIHFLSSLFRNKPDELQGYYRYVQDNFADPWKELKQRYSGYQVGPSTGVAK